MKPLRFPAIRRALAMHMAGIITEAELCTLLILHEAAALAAVFPCPKRQT